MLKFVKIDREMPQKRAADTRNKDFNEIYASSQPKKQKNKRVVVMRGTIANRIVRCTTTSLTGCA